MVLGTCLIGPNQVEQNLSIAITFGLEGIHYSEISDSYRSFVLGEESMGASMKCGNGTCLDKTGISICKLCSCHDPNFPFYVLNPMK